MVDTAPFDQLVEWMLPPFDAKQRFTFSNLPVLLAPLPLLLLQVHLLVRYHPPSTLLLRLALVPFIVALGIRHSFAFYFDFTGAGQVHGRAQCYNFALGVLAVYVALRAIEWGTMLRTPRLRGRPDAQSKLPQPLPLFFPGTWTPIELDVLLNMRGIGWQSGTPPPSTGACSRRRWLLGRVRSFVSTLLLLDTLEAVLHHPMLDPSRTAFYASHLGGCVLTLLCGVTIYTALQAGSGLVSVLAVGLMRQDVARWEPGLLSSPWEAESVSEFWSCRWHHLFRQSFMHLGYRPLARVARPLGVMGVFLVSAYLHEWGQMTMAPPPHPHISPTALFFLAQGVAVLIEQAWQHATRLSVSGCTGRLWTWSFLLVSATDTCRVRKSRISIAQSTFTDPLPILPLQLWIEYGVADSVFPTPKIVHPFVNRLIDRLASLL